MSDYQSEHPYFGDVLVDNGNGCQMDLRLKLAIEFLKSGVAISHPRRVAPVPGGEVLQVEYENTVAGQACHALELAGELLSQARARGWVKDLPDHGELSARQRHHIDRVSATNVYQSESQNRVLMEKGQIQRAPPGLQLKS